VAVDHDAHQAADVLLQLGADATDALMLAVEAPNKLWFLETFKAMVGHHTHASRRVLERMDWAQCAVARGHTPLTLAIFYERYEAMRLLLCNGRLPVHFIEEPVHSPSSATAAEGGGGGHKRKCTAMDLALVRNNADAILLLGAARAVAQEPAGALPASNKRQLRHHSSASSAASAHSLSVC